MAERATVRAVPFPPHPSSIVSRIPNRTACTCCPSGQLVCSCWPTTCRPAGVGAAGCAVGDDGVGGDDSGGTCPRRASFCSKRTPTPKGQPPGRPGIQGTIWWRRTDWHTVRRNRSPVAEQCRRLLPSSGVSCQATLVARRIRTYQ